MKALIIYYSFGGNTERIAKMIEKETGADMLEINTAKPYTGSYNEIVDQGHREINSNFLPELKPFEADFDKYDTIIIGSPVWWYTYAPAMRSFLNKVKLSGKTVYPFATNGGWIGHTFEDFAATLPDCTVEKGLNVYFDESTLRTSQAAITAWAKQICE